jgi:hypothetical protein
VASEETVEDLEDWAIGTVIGAADLAGVVIDPKTRDLLTRPFVDLSVREVAHYKYVRPELVRALLQLVDSEGHQWQQILDRLYDDGRCSVSWALIDDAVHRPERGRVQECDQCGSRLQDDVRFCTTCGASAQAANRESAPEETAAVSPLAEKATLRPSRATRAVFAVARLRDDATTAIHSVAMKAAQPQRDALGRLDLDNGAAGVTHEAMPDADGLPSGLTTAQREGILRTRASGDRDSLRRKEAAPRVRVRRIQHCARCGRPLRADALRFCTACGAPVATGRDDGRGAGGLLDRARTSNSVALLIVAAAAILGLSVFVVSLAILGHTHRSQRDAYSAGPTTTVDNEAAIRLGAWFLPAKPYARPTGDAALRLSTAASNGDFPALKRAAVDLQNALHAFRLAMESSGPPPDAYASHVQAVLDATLRLEAAARSVQGCPTINDCLSTAQRFNDAEAAFNDAMRQINRDLA